MSSIRDLEREKNALSESLYTKKTFVTRLIFFGRHYSYLNKWGLQILFWLVMLVSLSLIKYLCFPSIIWGIYDYTRADKLINKANEPKQKRINEINNIILEHKNLQASLNHTLTFARRINKKAS